MEPNETVKPKTPSSFSGPRPTKLRVAQITLLLAQSGIGSIGALLGAVTLGGVLWTVVSHGRIVVWLSAYVALFFGRYYLIHSFHSRKQDDDAVIKWGKWHTLVVNAAGLLWGVAGVWLFPQHSILHQFLLCIFVAGIAAAATVIYSPTKDYIPNLLLALLPLSGRCIYEVDEFHVIIGGVILLFAGALLLTGRKMHGVYADSLRLRYDKEKIVEDLKHEIAQRDRLEVELKRTRDDLEVRVEERTVELKTLNCTLEQEIVERKRVEEALRESEQRYRRLFEDAPLMYVITRNEQGVPFISDCNDLFVRSLSCTREDVVGQTLADFYSPESRAEMLDRGGYERALEGDFLMGERQLRARSGRLIPTLLYTTPEVDSYDRVIGTRAMFVDVTERKRVEEALRESEVRYRHLFDNSPVGIISVDTKGLILEVNQPLLDVLGSPSIEATRAINMFELPQLVESRVSDAFRSCMTKGERVVKDVPYVSLWGKQSHLRFVLTPMIDQERIVLGCQAIVEDITRQRALEEQLRQALKMEAVGTLAGGIAHDFNNLLHIISGHAELLDMELAERKLKFGELDAIRQSAHRGADLVKQILTFSRRIDSKFESINLNEEVRSTERLLYRTIPKMIEIELRLEKGLDRVRGDSSQIEQMLINLAVNAKDAMPEGGRLVIETLNVNLDEHYCESHAEIVPGQYVLLKVSDTGHGMEEDVRPHIFEPFFTTKGLADGTGLGLATTFGIVKMHGGHITCDSEVGRGTTFSIYLPAAEAGKPDMEQGPEVSAPAGGTEKILVVDDEPMIRDLAKRILEKSGYSVLTAGSGKEGIEAYNQHKTEISLVILDLIMPEMGGKQCLEELLKINPQVKAIIASGFAVKGDTKTFLDTEAKGIVPKPFNMRELLRSVRHVLDET
jgi:two-component system, cell cycle sensor histidine kinase and response regulator CckA